jgi:hypothetical protein
MNQLWLKRWGLTRLTTVMVRAAWVTVTVTGAQAAPELPAPAPPATAPEFASVDPAADPVATWETVMYLVDVETWVMVVVILMMEFSKVRSL